MLVAEIDAATLRRPMAAELMNVEHPRRKGRRRARETGAPLLLTHIKQLVTLASEEAAPRRGPALSELGIIEDAAVLCAGGKIVSVGRNDEAVRDPWVRQHKKELRQVDCRGMVVIPGFVDSHTHPVFAAPRLVDFEKRIAGATYEEIAEAGGGIRSSIEAVREASRAELSRKTLAALQQMAAQGTTTVEAKSGYGLSVASELKSLEAIAEAAKQFAGTVVPTLLAAHTIPPEFADDREEYVRLICEEMIPQADEAQLAWFVDVFVERGAFTPDEAEQILTAAWQRGLGARLHACQLTPASLHGLLKFDLASLDHMDNVSDGDIVELAQANTVVSLLPASNYFLGSPCFPPARKLIDAGVPVALATDYNPGTAPTPSMPLVLSLACTHMKMSPAEAIAAATINGACALRIADRKGSIQPGKDADLAIFDADDYREIPYWFGVNHCAAVVVNGEMLDRRRMRQ
ncbi:MAG: imidazolonepropionase [Terriglobales bacterium]